MYHPRPKKMDSAKMETLTEIPAFAAAESWCDGGRRASGISVGNDDGMDEDSGGLAVGDPLPPDREAEGRPLEGDGAGVVCVFVISSGLLGSN